MMNECLFKPKNKVKHSIVKKKIKITYTKRI